MTRDLLTHTYKSSISTNSVHREFSETENARRTLKILNHIPFSFSQPATLSEPDATAPGSSATSLVTARQVCPIQLQVLSPDQAASPAQPRPVRPPPGGSRWTLALAQPSAPYLLSRSMHSVFEFFQWRLL